MTLDMIFSTTTHLPNPFLFSSGADILQVNPFPDSQAHFNWQE